jgi:hypothetical protein
MKKLIQISLIIVLVLVLFQATVGGLGGSPSKAGSGAAGSVSFTASTSIDDVYATACLVYIKGVVCVRPNVGWNS